MEILRRKVHFLAAAFSCNHPNPAMVNSSAYLKTTAQPTYVAPVEEKSMAKKEMRKSSKVTVSLRSRRPPYQKARPYNPNTTNMLKPSPMPTTWAPRFLMRTGVEACMSYKAMMSSCGAGRAALVRGIEIQRSRTTHVLRRHVPLGGTQKVCYLFVPSNEVSSYASEHASTLPATYPAVQQRQNTVVN